MTRQPFDKPPDDGTVAQLSLMRAVLDSSTSFMHVLHGPDFVIEYANASYFRLVGQRDLIGRPAFEAMPEAAEGGFPERIAHVMQTGEPFFGRELPVTLARSPGSAQPEVRYIDLVYLRLDEAKVGPNRVVGHGTDVTEHVLARRGAEKLTRETHDRLSDALTAAKMAAWEWDPTTGQLSHSEAMPQLYRLAADEGRRTPADWQEALHPEHKDAHAELVRRAVEGHGSWHTEFKLRGDDEVWLEERAQVKAGEASGGRIVGLVWDISERKKLEMALRKADERKGSFLATLSHELRNPLAPIGNGLELLKRLGGLPDSAVSVHNMMERQLTHLVRLVDDLMDVNRITRGKVALRKDQVLLGSSLSAAIETVAPRIAAKEIRLETQIDGMHPVEGDRDRLTQVFANLLSNSAKFTPSGGTIRVSATTEARHVVVRVSDSGCGIAVDRLDSVFEMFSQGPDHQIAGGLGIGLALVRELVLLHGGSVRARSDGVGRGSEFIVALPLSGVGMTTDGRPGDDQHDISRTSQTREVLVVDDNVDAADSLAEALRARGHSVRTAHDGLSALEACETRLPEVIVLDIGMPGLDGYEVARRISIRWQASKRPRLAALTGWGQLEDKQQAAAAGFDAHFTKPVRLAEMLTELAL